VSAGEGLLRVEALPWRVHGSRAPLWWGMLLVVAIETTVFATLLSSYLYLRAGAAEWPPADIPLPGLLLPGINTVVLLTSSVAVFWASRGLARGDQRRLKLGLGAGILLEVTFFVIKLIESQGFGYGWGTDAYASIFWSISGLHTVHVLIAILMAAAAGVLALKGYYTEERTLGIQVVSIYWQFVAAIWIPVAFVLYLVPRWL
jgi:cytochrome c oxidase subunit III